MELVFRIIVNKKKSVTYCQQVLFVVKVFCVHSVHCEVRADDCDMIRWIVGFNLIFDVHIKPDTFFLLNHYTIIMALAFRIIG